MVSTETVGLITASGVKVLALSAWASLKPPMSYYSFIRVEVKVPHSACAVRAGVTIFFLCCLPGAKQLLAICFLTYQVVLFLFLCLERIGFCWNIILSTLLVFTGYQVLQLHFKIRSKKKIEHSPLCHFSSPKFPSQSAFLFPVFNPLMLVLIIIYVIFSCA